MPGGLLSPTSNTLGGHSLPEYHEMAFSEVNKYFEGKLLTALNTVNYKEDEIFRNIYSMYRLILENIKYYPFLKFEKSYTTLKNFLGFSPISELGKIIHFEVDTKYTIADLLWCTTSKGRTFFQFKFLIANFRKRMEIFPIEVINDIETLETSNTVFSLRIKYYLGYFKEILQKYLQ